MHRCYNPYWRNKKQEFKNGNLSWKRHKQVVLKIKIVKFRLLRLWFMMIGIRMCPFVITLQLFNGNVVPDGKNFEDHLVGS